jgi:hypothetical protein
MPTKRQGRRQGRKTTGARRLLARRRHALFRLADDLLLVFKPRHHREEEHAHPYPQRLRVLRGQLVVRIAKRYVTLRPKSRPLTLAAGQPHDTLAVKDTWLVAESVLAEDRLR